MTISARKLIDLASAAAEHAFAQDACQHPLFLCVTEDGRHLAMPLPPVDKNTGLAIIKCVMEAEGVVAYVYVSEAWMAYIDRADAAAFFVNPRPANEHPERIEAVILQAEDAAGRLIGIRLIHRPENGAPYLGPLEVEQSAYSEGRFVGLLPRRGTLQ